MNNFSHPSLVFDAFCECFRQQVLKILEFSYDPEKSTCPRVQTSCYPHFRHECSCIGGPKMRVLFCHCK